MVWEYDPDENEFSVISPCKCAKSHVKKYQDGIAEGYEIACMDGSFHVHEYCLFNSEFLYNMLQGSDTTSSYLIHHRCPRNHAQIRIKTVNSTIRKELLW